MNQETLNELISKSKDPNEQWGFINSFSHIRKEYHKDCCKALNFILELRNNNVALDMINVSDWSSSSISVYVGKRKYMRFSDYDLKNALRSVKK